MATADQSPVKGKKEAATEADYPRLMREIAKLLEVARRQATRSINAILTASYWEVGRRIVKFEQEGKERATYGAGLLKELAADLTQKFGRGFSQDNLESMRLFYIAFPPDKISETVSRKLPEPTSKAPGKSETASRILDITSISAAFPLSWSHYVRLIRNAGTPEALDFYHTEALRGGWSVRQLDRQISSKFYERTAMSRNKAGMLSKGSRSFPEDRLSAEEEIKDPYVLEFLNLKDEYSENDLEEALILRLEHFMLELGGDFAFIGRQKRLRIGNEWYRVDLLLYHRRLRCLVVIDLKIGRFTHADAGQMHMYLNYAREHWTHKEENPPVGLILCAQKDSAVAKYALEGLSNKILAAEYKLALPKEKLLAAEIEHTRKILESRAG